MMKQRNYRLSVTLTTMLSTLVLAVGSVCVQAATLNDVYRVADRINQQAKRSQSRIDELTDDTRALLTDYKTVLKEIEGLKVYNTQLQKQISSQEAEMAQLSTSIDEVTVIERQVTPFMLRMIDGLEQFVGLDMPFLEGERADRLAELREMMDRADVTVAEKFNRVMRAYQIENEYGRTMEAYDANINIGGNDRKVEVLKVGRVALVYQTSDGSETGTYNKDSGQWEPLSDSYKASVRNGIRMARKQLSVNMLTLPVNGPEAGQ